MAKVDWNNKAAKLLMLVFGILSFIVLSSCVTTADGSTYVDLNTLIFGNYVDGSWTHVQLPAAPSADGLMRLSAFTKEASNLARYVPGRRLRATHGTESSQEANLFTSFIKMYKGLFLNILFISQNTQYPRQIQQLHRRN